MKSLSCGSTWIAVILMWSLVCPATAIEVRPSTAQIQTALDRGREASARHQLPDMFYARFGATDAFHPNGFLVTKLGALSVLATHMALRGLEPSAADIAQVTEAPTMLVSAVILGDSPSFAIDSYMVLDQEGRAVKPVTVRVDGQAGRSSVWPQSPKFQAKVVASFNYADFDPMAQTTIIIFPPSGGEVRFSLNFAELE